MTVLTTKQRELLESLKDGEFHEISGAQRLVARNLFLSHLIDVATYESRNPHVRITGAGYAALRESSK